MFARERIIVCSVSLLFAVLACWANTVGTRMKQEQFLTTVPSVVASANIIVSQNGATIAYVQSDGNKVALMKNGVELGRYEGIIDNSIQLSSDGSRVVAAVMVGGKRAVICNDTIGQLYEEILPGTPILEPKTGNIIYFARDGQQWYRVTSELNGKTHLSIGYQQIVPYSLCNSPDGLTLSFIVQENDRYRIVAQSKDGPSFDAITPPIFSSDGKHMVYTARTGNTWRLVVDTQAKKPYESIGVPVYSPDGKIIYFSVKHKSKWTLMKLAPVILVEGTKGTPVIGPDGKQCGFVYNNEMTRGTKVVVEQNAGKPFDAISSVVVSPDGSRVIYAAQIASSWYIIEGDKLSPAYEAVGVPQFSSDGQHVVYTAKNNSKWEIIFDGKPLGPKVDELGIPQFSPNGSRVMVTARQAGMWSVIVDGAPGCPYDEVGTPTWSVQGTHFAYAARSKTGWCAVINGVEGAAYQSILGRKIYFVCEYEKKALTNNLGTLVTPETWFYLAAKPSTKKLHTATAVDFVRTKEEIRY